MIGLFTNCRKKPGVGSQIDVTMGSPGRIRLSPLGMPNLAIAATDYSQVLANTVYSTATLGAETIDSKSIGPSHTLYTPSPITVLKYGTHGFAGYCGKCLNATAGTGGSPIVVGAFINDTIPAFTTNIYNGLFASTNLSVNNNAYVYSNQFTPCTIELIVNGSSFGSQTCTGTNTWNIGTGYSKYTLYNAQVKIVNPTSGPVSVTVKMSGDLVINGGYGLCGLVDATYPIYMLAGFDVYTWDASDHSGAGYTTMTCTTYGTGQSYVDYMINYGIISHQLTATTAAHTCDIDELVSTWVS